MKKLNPLYLVCFAFLIFLNQGYAQTGSDNIIGLYWSPKKDAKIELFRKGDHYFGKSVWVATPRKDSKNPNESLRIREILGIELLTNFTFSDGVYKNGEVYDPENGKTYSCKMSLNGNQLKVRGYIGISLLGRTETFERIK